MNMSEALYALSSQAPSSKLMPTCPFKSVRPKLSIRPVRVTSPAPMTTPRIPRRGLGETSEGMAAAAPRAISIGDGRTIALEAAILVRLPPRPDGCNNGESGAEVGSKGAVIKRNLDRDALY